MMTTSISIHDLKTLQEALLALKERFKGKLNEEEEDLFILSLLRDRYQSVHVDSSKFEQKLNVSFDSDQRVVCFSMQLVEFATSKVLLELPIYAYSLNHSLLFMLETNDTWFSAAAFISDPIAFFTRKKKLSLGG